MNAFARVLAAAVGSLALGVAAPSLALAKVHISVDLDMQTIHVESKDKTYDWKVSSGKTGYDTPAGTFKVLWMDKDHHSDEYEQAFMPNAIFFAPGFAIHGFAKSPWGHKASHGCVRLPMAQSALLFDMVKAEGADITITGVSDRKAPTVAEVEAKKRAAASDDYAATDPADDTRAYGAPRYASPRYDQQPGPARGYGRGDDGYADAGYGYQPPRPQRGGLGALFGGFY